jgi:hypothetical protein
MEQMEGKTVEPSPSGSQPNGRAQPPSPPYMAFATFLTAVEGLEQAVPRKLDRSAWRSLAGRSKTDAMNAFKFMSLIEQDGTTKPALTRLADEKEQRKAILRELLEKAYPGVVELAKSNGTISQLQAEIAKMGVQGQTMRKSVSFFLKAAEYAGMQLSPQWQNYTRSNPDRPRKKRNTPRAAGNGEAVPPKERERKPPADEQPPAPPVGESVTVKLRSGRTVTLLVSGSILSMPTDDRAFLFSIIDRLQEYGEDGQQP